MDNINSTYKYKLSNKEKYCYIFFVLILLYLFMVGLDFISISIQVLSSNKTFYNFILNVTNPIMGVSIGIYSTVLFLSSSTTTSIIVIMVSVNLLSIKQAIPIIMGANVGTSLTSTLVSILQKKDIQKFKLAFSGGTVHDMFNFLSLIILLSIELITNEFNYPLLYNISKYITNNLINFKNISFTSPLKLILDPFVHSFIKVDKKIITGLINGCVNCNNSSNYCIDNYSNNCIIKNNWNNIYNSNNIIKSGILKDISNNNGCIIGILLGLFISMITIYFIVKILQKLIMSNNQGKILNIIKKSFNISPYLTLLFGILLTILVQSSSVITSTFTPLVGLSVLSIENMYPLTLGTNIGTTCTALLVSLSLVDNSEPAIQIAIVHFLFNLLGTLFFFPIPYFRKIPINMAKRLGCLIEKYNKNFAIFYISYIFIYIPSILYCISLLISINNLGLIFGLIFILLTFIKTIYLFYKFENIIKYIKNKYYFKYNELNEINEIL